MNIMKNQLFTNKRKTLKNQLEKFLNTLQMTLSPISGTRLGATCLIVLTVSTSYLQAISFNSRLCK